MNKEQSTIEYPKSRTILEYGLALTLGLFVLIEVNYPLLQPQSRLALFVLLGFSYLFVNHPRTTIASWITTVLGAGLSVVVFAYVIVQTEPILQSLWIQDISLGERAGQETQLDYQFGFLGLMIVLVATQRTIGWTLPILAIVFLLYAWLGSQLPNALFPHRGYSWSRIVSQTFLHSQGVFGIALKVMFTYVFPFVLFGAFLESTGATGFIIELSQKLFRNSPGGPAKVAVLSSGLMGSLSGSAVANTATTGTFTIPMMRSSGFAPHLAAGVEAAASSGGALMPPIMGAGAYMMLEIIDPPVTYLQIVRAAIVPALLYYLTLILVVHFHARKIGLQNKTSVKMNPKSLQLAQGMVFLLAMLTLIVFLLLGFTPFRAVTLSLFAILVVSPWSSSTRLTGTKILQTFRSAARGGLALIAAASCVGIILGVVTLTGLGSKLPSTILPLAQNNLLLALFLLMVSTIILGMGLPSAVCYLLMATLVGPILAKLGLVPLAVHLFIFYFGMMSMVTPPVALAGYTAAAIAKADVLKTSFAAFRFAIVGFVLPYAFVLNPSLLLLSDSSQANLWLHAILNIVLVMGGVFLLSVCTTGFCFREVSMRSRIALFATAMFVILSPTSELLWFSLKIISILIGGFLIFLNSRPSTALVKQAVSPKGTL